MPATTVDLSAIRTDATAYAATFRALIGVDLALLSAIIATAPTSAPSGGGLWVDSGVVKFAISGGGGIGTWVIGSTFTVAGISGGIGTFAIGSTFQIG